jgi:hypothetical protein
MYSGAGTRARSANLEWLDLRNGARVAGSLLRNRTGGVTGVGLMENWT